MRLFVAIPIPQEIREGLRALIEELRAAIGGARWVRPEAIHLTLRFLGEVQETSLPALGRALRSAVTGATPPFTVRVGGIGTFPERGRPRVLWVGLGEQSGSLSTLQARVELAVAEAALPGAKKESRPFAPHLTLARLAEGRPPAGLSAAIEARSGTPGPKLGSFTVTSVRLFQSLLKPAGAEYRVIEEYRL